MKIPFKIESIDPLGQGVSKSGEKVTFIPKTLLKESGICDVLKEHSKFQFALPVSIDSPSSERQEPSCVHFQNCTSCHYLHTNYSNELKFKAEALKSIFSNQGITVDSQSFKITAAPRRQAYRNRIQLHYDLKSNKLGLINRFKNSIIEVPFCELPLSPIKQTIESLYENQRWATQAKKQKKTKGHVEILLTENNVTQVIWNQNYANDGFTQVFDEMNQKLKEVVVNLWKKLTPTPSGGIDLFGGNGNLSAALDKTTFLVADSAIDHQKLAPHQSSCPADLYQYQALASVKSKAKNQGIAVSPLPLLILDPPRTGLKNIQDWVSLLTPESVFYVSCNPATLVRDLQTIISYYTIISVDLLDLFPSTYHYETVVMLKRKNS